MNESRERFEAAIRAEWPNWSFEPDASGGYHQHETDIAWVSWEAARAVYEAPPQHGSPLGRDADWILAMGHALGLDSGFSVPIVPTPEAFQKLFAAIRERAGEALPLKPKDQDHLAVPVDAIGPSSTAKERSMDALEAALRGLLEIEDERIATGAFTPNAEGQRRIDAARAVLAVAEASRPNPQEVASEASPPSPLVLAAISACNHWNEFGPEHGFDESMDRLERLARASEASPQGTEPLQGVGQPDKLEQIVDDYLDGYELIGDDGSYTPSERERFLMKDAILGLLADPEWDAEWGKHIASLAAQGTEPPQSPLTDEQMREIARDFESDDAYLEGWIRMGRAIERAHGIGHESAPPVLSVRQSEWQTLSPEAQAKLEQITGAIPREEMLRRAQAAEDARRIPLVGHESVSLRTPSDCAQPPTEAE